MGRLLGIDYGSVRVGLALSDPTKIIASPYTTLEYDEDSTLFKQINGIIKNNDVTEIIVGFPLGMKAQVTSQTKVVDSFIKALKEHTSLPIKRVDERLTSVQAKRSLNFIGVKPSKNKAQVDMIAASLLLQSYLDSL